MLALDLFWNALLLGADVAALAWVRKRRTARSAVEAVAAGGFAACFGAVLGGGFFGITRLWAWAIFLHGPVLLGVLAVLLRGPARIAAAVLGLATAAVGIDAFLVEPFRLELTRVRVETPKLKAPLRIGVLADFQADAIGPHEERAVRLLLDEKPDLLLLPGDFLQCGSAERPALRRAMQELLRRAGFSAPLGAFAVGGDVDPRDWPAIFEGLPVTCLEPTRSLDVGPLRLTGLDFDASCDPRARVAPSDRFHLVFGHRPDFALGDVRADLLVAGHTHGGQVRLPGIGPLVTMSRVPRAWAAGTTALEGGRTLVVSRGVGMERGSAPRLRFLCRPEVVVIDLVPSPRGP
jgi:hypothetical protein